jgi:cobalamin synthase
MDETEQPFDEARTTRPRAGMVFKDRREAPGLAMLVMAVLALVGLVSAATQHHTGWAVGFGILVLVLAVAGVSWILVGRNRAARTTAHHRRQT